MSGNVYEWVWDWYGDYGSKNGTDLVGPVSGSYRVSRGGCLGWSKVYTRVSGRDKNDPTGRLNVLGFRLSRITP